MDIDAKTTHAPQYRLPAAQEAAQAAAVAAARDRARAVVVRRAAPEDVDYFLQALGLVDEQGRPT